MTDTEKLELRRKVCEALYPGKDIRIEAAHVWICDRTVDSEGWISKRTAPALESDNGLALDALVQWCAENKARYELFWDASTGSRREHYCSLVFLWKPHRVVEEGVTPAEAICKAIIASTESIRKAGK